MTRAFPGEIRHHEKLKANIKKRFFFERQTNFSEYPAETILFWKLFIRPPGTEEEKPSTPVITEEIDLNSTISLEQIERVNSMSNSGNESKILRLNDQLN